MLIFVPKFGLYGVVASYYASNIIGNCSRFVRLLRVSGTKMRHVHTLVMPLVFVFLTMGTSDLIFRIFPMGNTNVFYMVIFTAVWGIIYGGIIIRTFSRKNKLNICLNFSTPKRLSKNRLPTDIYTCHFCLTVK